MIYMQPRRNPVAPYYPRCNPEEEAEPHFIVLAAEDLYTSINLVLDTAMDYVRAPKFWPGGGLSAGMLAPGHSDLFRAGEMIDAAMLQLDSLKLMAQLAHAQSILGAMDPGVAQEIAQRSALARERTNRILKALHAREYEFDQLSKQAKGEYDEPWRQNPG